MGKNQLQFEGPDGSNMEAPSSQQTSLLHPDKDVMETPLVSNLKKTPSNDVDPEDLIKSLECVKSGFETEAETHILKAIGKLDDNDFMFPDQKKGHSRGHARGSSLLSGVPASAVHLFENDLNGSGHNLSDTAGELSSSNHPANFDIVKPSDTATPSLEDIKSRMDMIQKLAVVREKTMRNLNTPETFEGNQLNDTFVDPESPMDNNHQAESAPEAVTSESEPAGNETDYTNRYKKSGGCFRTCFAPFFLFARLTLNGFHDSGKYILAMYFYLAIPLIAVSAILYYILENPIASLGASYSWWLLFAVRHLVTLLLSQCTQFVLIDYIALETRLAVLFVGRLLTLMAMQAKGWPMITVMWSLWNFALNYGDSKFKMHWLHMQDWIEMFGTKNTAGTVVTHRSYHNVLIMMLVVGVTVMIKRVFIALWLGRKNYVTYAGKMESLMRKVLLISEVAMLSQDIALGTSQGGNRVSSVTTTPFSNKKPWLLGESLQEIKNDEDDDDDDFIDDDIGRDRLESSEMYSIRTGSSKSFEATNESDMTSESFRDTSVQILPPKKSQQGMKMRYQHVKEKLRMRHKASEKKTERKSTLLSESTDRILLDNLLGEWEEPELRKKFSWKDSSIMKILQFRETLHYLDGGYPLSVPFGAAETRKQCLRSSQKVYQRLMLDRPKDSILHFDTIVTLARDKEGKIQKDKARALIRLFRPDRDGHLTLLDFAKSCDRVYKRIKMFRVVTSNAVQIDEAFEKILNVVFYFILSLFALFGLGVDPIGIFTGLTGLLLPLSFLFSSASSQYFEGILLVLARQPYDIGDRIAVSNPMNDTSPDGSTTWFVENITLFTTTVRNAATNEVGTYANGSLASLRIINAARSSNAVVSCTLKFGVDVPYEKVKVFRTVVEGFVKARPREWLSMLGFRATAIQADLGYIQYVIYLQHIDSWQNLGIVKESLANVASFCLEVSKKMDMRFVNPPVSLRVEDRNDFRDRSSSNVESDVQKISNMFGEA